MDAKILTCSQKDELRKNYRYPERSRTFNKIDLVALFFMAVKKKRRAIKAPLGSCLCANSITVGLKGGCSSTVFPLCLASCFPHGGGWFVLLMTPSCYDLIQFVLSNWWHTDILGCRRRGSHCKHFSPTNKVLLLMINGNEGEVCVCVRDREKEKKKEDDVDDEWLWLEVLLQIREVAVMKHFTSNFKQRFESRLLFIQHKYGLVYFSTRNHTPGRRLLAWLLSKWRSSSTFTRRLRHRTSCANSRKVRSLK